MATGATAGAVRMGRAFVSIDAVDNTARVLRRIGANMQRFGQQVTNWGSRTLMGGILANLGTAVAAREFSSVDDVLRRVQAKSKGTAAEMSVLAKQLRTVSIESGIAATQVGSLMEQLAQGGFSYAEIAQMTPAITKLSLAGGSGSSEDQAMAADAVTQAIRSFNLQAKDATMVGEILTVALNDSNFALEDLLTTMSYVGPVAKEFGGDLKSSVALAALLRNVGINASVAGTAVRNMYLQMSSETSRNKFNDGLKEAGRNTIKFIDDAGALRPLPEILRDIGKETATLGSAKKSSLFGDLLGLRALVPAMLLATDLAGRAGGQFEKMMAGLSKHQGVLDETSSIINDGLGGSLRKMWQSTVMVVQVWGEQFAPMLKGGADYARSLTKEIAAWAEKNQKLVVGITAAAAALPILGVALIATGWAIQFVGATMVGLATIMSFLIATVSTVVAILGTPVGIGVIGTMLVAVPVLILFWEELAKAASDFMSYLGSFDSVNGLITTISNFFGIGVDGFKKLKEETSSWGSIFIEALTSGQIQVAMDTLVAGLELSWMTLKDTILEMWDQIELAIKSAYNAWRDLAVGTSKDQGWMANVAGLSQGIRGEELDIQARQIQERRDKEQMDLIQIGADKRTPEQNARLDLLLKSGKMGGGPTAWEHGQAGFNESIKGWNEAEVDPEARKRAREKEQEARRKELENSLLDAEFALEANREAERIRRLRQFTPDDTTVTPGAEPPLPKGVPEIASLSKELNHGVLAGTIEAMAPGSNGTSVTDLLEEANEKHDEEIALATEIRDILQDESKQEYAV